MQTLKEEFTKSGWNHRQLLRTEKKAIYARWKETSVAPHYEVLRITISKETTVNLGGQSITYPEQEHYPSEREFGRLAWSFQGPKEALKRYEEL